MFKHVVMWRLKPEADGRSRWENAVELKERLERLPPRIPELRDLEVGLNVSSSDAAADILLITAFASERDYQVYREHPEHERVVHFIRTIVADRQVVDYRVE